MWSILRLSFLVSILLSLGAGCAGEATAPADAPLSVVVSPAVDTLKRIGDSVLLTASVNGQAVDGSEKLSWTTLNNGVATVDSFGAVRAVAPGTALIVALVGELGDTATVVVSPATLTSLVLTPASVTLTPGASTQFTASGTWSDGSSTIPAVTYSATGGTITAGGLYTAGATPGTYRVVTTQQGGVTADSSTVAVITLPQLPSGCLRAVNTSTIGGLTSALSNALPGDCIFLSEGTYYLNAGLTITRSGTANLPIVLQGVGSGTIINVNQRTDFFLDASYVHFRKVRLTNFGRRGLWLRGATGVVIDSVEIDHTMQEALALKDGSHHNVVKNSVFHDTGTLYPQYGEGVYIGNSGSSGSPLDYGVTDNQLLNNHFGPNVRAEAVDLKEGADRTLIRGNYFDGTGTVYGSGALIGVSANGVTIDSNFMQLGVPQGVAFRKPPTRVMASNLATRNTIDLRDQFQAQRGTEIPYGFQFQVGTVNPDGAVIACDNVMLNGLLSNRPCTP